jgi:hypothetical protein
MCSAALYLKITYANERWMMQQFKTGYVFRITRTVRLCIFITFSAKCIFCRAVNVKYMHVICMFVMVLSEYSLGFYVSWLKWDMKLSICASCWIRRLHLNGNQFYLQGCLTSNILFITRKLRSRKLICFWWSWRWLSTVKGKSIP